MYWFTLQQLVQFFPPPLKELTHTIWNHFQPIDKKENDALGKFLKDRKKKQHVVEFDSLLKEVFQLYLSFGGWLKDNVCILSQLCSNYGFNYVYTFQLTDYSILLFFRELMSYCFMLDKESWLILMHLHSAWL